jgi:integrase
VASISKRPNGWFVQVRRKGFQPEYKTLPTKAAAERWAREREGAIDRGDTPANVNSLKQTTLADLIDRYLAEITPKKRSVDSERARMKKMLRSPVCSLALAELSPAALSAYRDARLRSVKPGTVIRELGLISNVLEIARKEWGIGPLSNPVKLVRRPPLRNARDRRLRGGELQRLEMALREARNPFLAPAVHLLIETALRRGELLKLEWRHIDTEKRTAHVPDTKTGYSRTIPLNDRATEILDELERIGPHVFPVTAMALKLAWNRARQRAGMPDLRLHDLRHEAISRFAEMGLTTMELAVISGHRDPRMLFRYSHLRPEDLAMKLKGRVWGQESAAC